MDGGGLMGIFDDSESRGIVDVVSGEAGDLLDEAYNV